MLKDSCCVPVAFPDHLKKTLLMSSTIASNGIDTVVRMSTLVGNVRSCYNGETSIQSDTERAMRSCSHECSTTEVLLAFAVRNKDDGMEIIHFGCNISGVDPLISRMCIDPQALQYTLGLHRFAILCCMVSFDFVYI